MSKKRHRSLSGLEENVQDNKRIKTDPSVDSEQSEINGGDTAKKKKKHSRRDATDETSKPQCSTTLEVAGVQQSEESTITKTEFERKKHSKKHKHHRHHDEIVLDEINEVTVKHELISNASANIVSANLHQTDNVEESSTPKKKKKKKKNREPSDDDDCVINFDVDVTPEVVDLVDDEKSVLRLVDSVELSTPNSSDIGEPGHKKKKKKHRKQNDSDDNPCFVSVQKTIGKKIALTDNSESQCMTGTRVVSANHQKASAISHTLSNNNNPPSELEKCFKRNRPAQLHASVDDLRFKPQEGYEECQPADQKKSLWWEDIATNPNLELWLVRAPADFSSSILSGTRGALYESVLVPQPDRPGEKPGSHTLMLRMGSPVPSDATVTGSIGADVPRLWQIAVLPGINIQKGLKGEGFQVSIQGVQQSKLVVLLPSKHDKKLHAASDVNGYVTITRSEAFRLDKSPEPKVSAAEELLPGLEFDGRKKSKKHKRKHMEEVPVDSSRKHEKIEEVPVDSRREHEKIEDVTVDSSRKHKKIEEVPIDSSRKHKKHKNSRHSIA